jgi:pantoate--beta-alanine ligase
MKVYSGIAPLKAEISKSRKSGKSIGFVPTMGNLHEGHISLLKACKKGNDISILSIYVNPTQFGKNEDLGKYPRTLKEDLAMAKEVGVDIVFTPTDQIIYPEGFSTYVTEERLSIPMEGKKRPGHFKGVLTVVAKLFNIIEPDRVYFGEKDAQQAILIRKMINDLNFDAEIKVLPTVRESNGLAMSSRNNYLSIKDREKASVIYKSLTLAKDAFDKGEKDQEKLLDIVRKEISKNPNMSIDYAEIRSLKDLEAVNKVEEALLAISVNFAGVHLIDNIILSRQHRNG